MYLSNFFLPVLKEIPSDAKIISHKLMLRSGMIYQVASGIYSWLPLGLTVLQNITNIIKKNLNEIGNIEILMPCIQPAELWRVSGRYDEYGPELLRIHDRHNNEMIFGPTNEELIANIFKVTVKSYKDLPKIFYQVQWKFRDEMRPRFGVMRGREFFMKDAYSFDISKDAAIQSYKLMYATYLKIFHDLGLKVIPLKADSGAIGGDFSHEFHVLADVGESTLYYDNKFEDLGDFSTFDQLQNIYAVTEEKHNPATCHIPKERLSIKKGIEVGQIFYIGPEKYSIPMNIRLPDSSGNLIPLEMGCYGIGISRLVAAIIEANHDENGIIWPKEVAPFDVSLINLYPEEAENTNIANDLYRVLKDKNINVLYDDILQRPGQKFAINDLIGMPYQIIIGHKAKEGLIELKERRTNEIKLFPFEQVTQVFNNDNANPLSKTSILKI